MRDSLEEEERVELLMRGSYNDLGIRGLNRIVENYQLNQPNDMLCEGGNVVTMMCINPVCEQSSLICPNQPSCLACGSAKHQNCYRILLEDLTKMLQRRAKIHKDFFLSLSQSEIALFQ